MPERNFIVDVRQAGVRLDIFLSKNFGESVSRSCIRRWIDGRHVTVNEKQERAHHKVHNGDRVHVDLPAEPSGHSPLEAEEIPLDILYEDEELLVINKPAGMLVHPVHGQNSGTLVNALLHHCRTLSSLNEADRPGIVHRLDRETSGVIIAAKTDSAHAHLAKQFEKHKVIKQYRALVKGCVEMDEGTVDASIGRHAVHFDKKAIAPDPEEGRSAVTFYKVIKRFGNAATMLALFPKTGRTHQLRVHMKHIGHPILGDEKYGNAKGFPRLALHAQAIRFRHPQKYYFLECSAPLPEEFLDAEAVLSANRRR